MYFAHVISGQMPSAGKKVPFCKHNITNIKHFITTNRRINAPLKTN